MDKVAFAKAIIICGMSWAAIPVLYYILKRNVENGSEAKKGEVGEALVKDKDASRGSG